MVECIGDASGNDGVGVSGIPSICSSGADKVKPTSRGLAMTTHKRVYVPSCIIV